MGQLSATAMSLLYLRVFGDLQQNELTARLGLKDEKLLSRYETGKRELSREQLEEVLAPLKYPPEAVDLLLFTHALLTWLVEAGEPEEAAGPLALGLDERRSIVRSCLTAAWTVAERLRTVLEQDRRQEKAAAARREAEEPVKALLAAPEEERRELVGIFPEFQGWAVAEALSHESVRRAAHEPGEALELAELALAAAEREGDEGLRAAAQGYCWPYVGNALRVANDFEAADAAFDRGRERWGAAPAAARELFPAWRRLDLEASLRRAQQRFPDSLALLDQARRLADDDDLAVGRILLKREHVFERLGDLATALATLQEAAPRVEAGGDLRCRFALRFNTADVLCQLDRPVEAAALLPEVQELAERQARGGLSWLRVLWLGARIDAGQGRQEQAERTLELVRREFAERGLAYEGALACLDLAILLLEAGRTAEVRELANGMAWIFRAQGFRREALAALSLFHGAARQEAASAALARQVRAELRRIGSGPASRPAKRPKGRA
jgi:tetratricopeptide (TPR) repeat protein